MPKKDEWLHFEDSEGSYTFVSKEARIIPKTSFTVRLFNASISLKFWHLYTLPDKLLDWFVTIQVCFWICVKL